MAKKQRPVKNLNISMHSGVAMNSNMRSELSNSPPGAPRTPNSFQPSAGSKTDMTQMSL